MSKRVYVPAIVFLSILLSGFSCQDHQTPQKQPVLATLEVSPGAVRCEIAFNLDVTDIGNMPVTEYGVVIAGLGFSGQPTDTPAVGTHTKLIFDPPFSPGPKKKNSGVCSNHFSYRAYVLLSNGEVVYGNLLRFQNV